MRKAIVILGLLALAASGSKATAQARAIRVAVGGYMEQTFGYARNNDGVRASETRQTGFVPVVIATPNRLAQQSDTEIWFTGRATLANGLIVGFAVQLEGNSQFNDQIDESYLFVEGAFGRVVAGAENDAAYLQHVSAPRPGDGWGVLESAVTGWVYTPRFVSFLTTTAPLSAGDDQKLTWFAPRLAGIQLGVSLTPNDKQDAREFSDRDEDRTNLVSLSANGRWRWDKTTLSLSAGWVHGEEVRKASFADRRTPLDDWAIGAQARRGGTAIGAGFRRLANRGGALDGRAFAAGIVQDLGRISVGLSYLRSVTAGTAVSPGRDQGEILLLSGSYRLAPGVSAIASAFGARYDNGRSRFGAEDRNRGAGVVTGLRLSF